MNDLLQQIKWMNIALELAVHAATQDEVPVGCVVVHPTLGVIGSGFNRREQLNDPTAHAEILALREASAYLKSWRLHECTLYVTLEPCLMCAGAMNQSRIKSLVFATPDAKAGAIESLYQIANDNRLNHRFSTQRGIEAQSAAKLLKDFFRSKRK